MRPANVIRIAAWHLALYLFIICYILTASYVFFLLEGELEIERHQSQKNSLMIFKQTLIEQIENKKNAEIESILRQFMQNVSSLHITIENYLLFDDPGEHVVQRWTFPGCVLFSFTILTTIDKFRIVLHPVILCLGYGNVVPSTQKSQIFTMVFGALGIPLFLIGIADVGRFFKTFIMYLVQLIYRKEIKKQGERKLLREIGEVILVALLFLCFIIVGSAIMPLYETHMTYFDSLYFSYMSLSTIGLGDVVPKRMEYLIITLIYLTIGLWLTTALVEQLADVFRLVHYAGRQVNNIKGITVWLGGRRLSMGSLIQTICRRIGASDNIIHNINWDKTIDRALCGETPASIPIFPWHFADFLEKDPPLIDVSMDFERENSYYFHVPTICNSPHQHKKLTRKMSAPEISISSSRSTTKSQFEPIT